MGEMFVSKVTKEYQILEVLRSVGDKGVTNAELSDVALRYGGYLGKLYEKGYKIKKECLGSGLYRYTLLEEPEVEFEKGMSAYDKLIKAVSEFGSVDSNTLSNIISELNVSVRHKAGTHNSL